MMLQVDPGSTIISFSSPLLLFVSGGEMIQIEIDPCFWIAILTQLQRLEWLKGNTSVSAL